MASKPQATVPISRHPLFPTAVALWFAALLGLGSMAIRSSVLERIVLALHLDLVIPAAAPPLGFTARMLLALVLAGSGGIAGFFMARRMAAGTTVSSRVRTAASPTVIVPSSSTFINDDEDEDLARLEAARQDQPRRRRPLALAEETRPAEAHEFAPLPGGRPTILNIGELDPIPALGRLSAMEHDAPASEDAAMMPEPAIAIAEAAPTVHESLPAAETVAAPQPVVAVKRQAPPALAPLPLATSAPVDGTAATRLREAPLEALGVVELVERFALALAGRRERASAGLSAALPTTSASLPEPAPLMAEEAPIRPELPIPDQSSRLFDIPAALPSSGLDDGAPNGWTSNWFAKAPASATPDEAPPAPLVATAEHAANFTTEWRAAEDLDEVEAEDDGCSSLLDLKPSIRAASADPISMLKGQHVSGVPVPGAPVPGAIIPGAAFGNGPAETERALREALTALQRMSGAA